jgi:hypothetical protein
MENNIKCVIAKIELIAFVIVLATSLVITLVVVFAVIVMPIVLTINKLIMMIRLIS